jgi:hypothetical protein
VVVEKKGASIHNPGAWPTFSLSLKDASKISNSGSSSVPVRHTLIIRMPFIFASLPNRMERGNLSRLITSRL